MNRTEETSLSTGRLALLAFALIFLTTAFGCHHNPRRPDPAPPRHAKQAPMWRHHKPVAMRHHEKQGPPRQAFHPGKGPGKPLGKEHAQRKPTPDPRHRPK